MKKNIKELLQTKLEKLKIWNSEVTIFPERWWHIMSCIINWTELFYQGMYKTEELLKEWHKPKWWMPYMFPNAWPMPKNWKYSQLPQHGFWRLDKYSKAKSDIKNSLNTKLNFNKPEEFTYKWTINNNISIDKNDWSVIFDQEILNLSEKEMPISTWLHPYFRIPNWVKKSEIKFLFEWWKKIESELENWENTLFLDNPWTPLKIKIPWIWIITIEVSDEYRRLWIWTLPWKDFVCIEPVMWDPWNLEGNPVVISGFWVNRNFMKLSLEK